MYENKIVGTIETIFDVQQISQSFRKRECVINSGGTYAQQILVQFTNDQCDLLDGLKLDDHVEIDINIRGKEWTGPNGEVKYFVTLQGWKISIQNDMNVSSKPATQTPQKPKQNPQPETIQSTDPDDDLPF